MSRVLQQDIEGKTITTVGPALWMSPESLRDKVYSKKSDVWMFGIVVYEIVSQCEPHTDKDPKEAIAQIKNTCLTPKIPNNCPDKLSHIMKLCWNKDPNNRPVSTTLIFSSSNKNMLSMKAIELLLKQKTFETICDLLEK
jgi:serine/threonine protein kinase